MNPRPPRSTRTDTPFPDTTLFRSPRPRQLFPGCLLIREIICFSAPRVKRQSPTSLTLLRGDPRIDPPFEDIERHGPRFEHDVVEGAEIELVAERRLRAAAQFHDLELADQIGGRLPRIDDIAFDRLFDFAVGVGGGIGSESCRARV